MPYDHKECRDVLFQALTGALADHIKLVRSLEEEIGLCAISYDILPWSPFIAISFRTADDGSDHETRYRPAEDTWSGYELIGERNARDRLAPALSYVNSVYLSADETDCGGQEMNHLIQWSAADALLDPKVAQLLQACDVPASEVTDQIPYREFAEFEYVVVDEDRVFNGNYCEMLCAMRVARRLQQGDL